MKKRLYKCEENKMLCGVCAGLAEYLNLDVSLVRLLCVLLALTSCGIILYIAAALILPDKSDIDE